MQDWERFGEEIRRTVQDAVDSQDYRKLNQTITDTINRAVNGAVNGAEQSMRSFGNAFDQATRNMGRGPGGPRGRYGQMGGADRWGRTPGGGVPPFGTYRWSGTDGNGRAWNPDMQDYKAESQGNSRYGYSNAQQSPVLYGSTTGTKAGGIVMIAAGGSIALIFLILFLASCIASLPESPGALWIMRAVFGLFTAASGMITGWGIKLLKQVGRFKNYSRRIAGREYCNISEIGSNSGKSIKFVTKDLERMISKGWFRQGHMDGEKKCLILSNRAYEEYLQIETRRQQSKAEEPVKKEEKTQENTKEKEAKKKQRTIDVKEVRLSPNIDTNDLNTKVGAARKFISKGDKVKVTLRFRGREMAHMHNSKYILDDFAEKLADIAVVEKAPKVEGRSMTMFLTEKR